MSETQEKPQLHVSMLDQMSRCGIQFQRRFGKRFGCWHKEEIIAPSIAMITGTTVHKSVEKDLHAKLASVTKSLLQTEEIEQIARDHFDGLWLEGVMLNDDEAINPKTTRGSAIDMTVALSKLHHDNLAPIIDPIALEEKFVIEMDNYPINLSGTKDVREKNGSIRDTKTKASTPPDSAVKSIQMGMYCISEKIERGKLPPMVSLDFLVKNKTPKIKVCSAVPDESWLTPVLSRIGRAIELIELVKEGKQAFTPADPDHWCCTKKFCGYALTCPFWSGK